MLVRSCDLHCHSSCSDGTASPEKLVQLAITGGLSAVALTDHNTVAGLSGAARAAAGRIEFCGGCELTTQADGQELHLLGLFLEQDRMGPIQEALEAQLRRKEAGNRETLERLDRGGYPVTWEEFLTFSGPGVKNRVHIARYLMSKGIVATISSAFRGLLSPEGGYYEETAKLDFFEMIPLISQAGGVSVWAHPLFHVDRDTCRDLLRRAKAAGLDGAECYYSTYTPEDTAFMQAECAALGLLESGGSDYHGDNKPGLQLGIGYGNLQVPYTCFERLRQRAAERRTL